jgi:sodium-dependent dicarboxylate transporter 2/3/5
MGPHWNWKKWFSLSLLILIALIVYFATPNLPWQQHMVLAIMVFTGALWLSEIVPLHIAALMVPVLLVILGGFTPKEVMEPFFSPVVVLLLGGFVLARALQKHGLDVRIAAMFVNMFGTSPNRFLFGMMFATAFLSLWVSNTASTAIMIPIGIAAIAGLGKDIFKHQYTKALVLGIAYAATIGGTGSLVGTTPNPIAANTLAQNGIQFGFMDWMVHVLPLTVLMLCVAWVILIMLHRTDIPKLRPPKVKTKGFNKAQKWTLVIFAATAILWVTDSFHGIHSSVIALLPVIGLYLWNLLDIDDMSKIHWDVLILVGGGLSLGYAITASGLDQTLAAFLGNAITGQPLFIVMLALAAFSIGFTAFISNTAGAAILVPIIVPLAATLGVGIKPMVLLVGVAVSFDFIVPVGTPPSAIAYSTGYVRVKDMVRAGILISIAGAILTAVFAYFFW